MSAEEGKGKTDVTKHKEAELSSLYEEYYDKIAHYAYVRIGIRAG